MASKRAERRKKCTAKRRFDTFQDARAHAAGLMRYENTGAMVTPYHCKYCGGYHIGHISSRWLYQRAHGVRR